MTRERRLAGGRERWAPPPELAAELDEYVAATTAELVELRRDLHRHPELGWRERRTTGVLRQRLEAAGLSPEVLPTGTGLVCDVGPAPRVGLRADIDALPVQDAKDVPYRSTIPGVTHACGHDVHTTVVLGAGLFLARLVARGSVPAGVRLVFQPAEEVMPGGALEVIAAGALDGLLAVYAVHCDPHTETGKVGLRVGPITSASDAVEVRVKGPGGHTARPHLTADLVGALADIAARAPALLARRTDPRAGVALVWGEIAAGSAGNAIPSTGHVRGTLRVLDHRVWETAPAVLYDVVHALAASYGVEVEIDHHRGVPPVVNDGDCVGRIADATRALLGPEALATTEQSLGGEDFGWYLERVPGALARLGVAAPGVLRVADLHQPTFDVDERSIAAGVKVLVGTALATLLE